MAKVHFKTIGCRLNQAESERLAQAFLLAGHEIVSDPKAADVRVVNTCTVTGPAGAESRRAGRPKREGQRVVVTGCHSEVAPDEFSSAELVVPNADKEILAALAMARFGLEGPALGMDHRPVGRVMLYPLALENTRAFVKIQNGCSLSCSFCLTTIARGNARSRDAEEIVAEIRGLAEAGCQEAVLTGVHAGAYGKDAESDLGWLVDRILAETAIPRLRLSSLEPWNFRPEWVELWTRYEGRLCRHLHMSLQSGSDEVLRRMRRGYRSDEYAEKIAWARDGIPDLALTTDLIVGFPGETDAEHAESLAFAERIGFAGAHLFTYSPRPGTLAAELPDRVPLETARARWKEIDAVVKASAARYREAFVGREVDVLWEQRDADGLLSGLTDTYLRVRAEPGVALPNEITRVRLDRLDGDRFRV